MNIYLFDVDGTLTLPRQPMHREFASFFEVFCKTQMVFLVSGSDIGKIREQVPARILKQCRGIFTCSGAEYYANDRCIYSREHVFPNSLLEACNRFVNASSYHERTGNHIEFRPGMLNISAVGRNASVAQRSLYFAWDMMAGERKAFAEQINAEHPEYETSCGGEISVDIVPKGWNKSVAKEEILKQFPDARLVFYGDRIKPGGNDMPLAEALDDGSNKHRSHSVEGYEETKVFLLQEMQNTCASWAA